MPYLTCRDGNIHSTYEQSPHVIQAIEYRYTENIPSYVVLIRCDKPLDNHKNSNGDSGANPLILLPMYFVGMIIIALFLTFICSKIFK